MRGSVPMKLPVLSLLRHGRRMACVGAVLLLAACASDNKPQPAELGPNVSLLSVRQVWTNRVGPVDFPLDVATQGGALTLASSDGSVAALDGNTGRDLWRSVAGAPVTAGAGSDGQSAAVVTRNNDLVVFERGREVWRDRLESLGYTAPLVAGARVFVLTADRTVRAYDLKTGTRLWTYARAGEQALALRQDGVMLAVGNTLVVGILGRLVGLDPLNGSVRWESAIANPRGTNDIERLVDLVGRVSRQGDNVCARAFQAAVGCVDTVRRAVVWTRPANGSVGIHGDADRVYGVEGDGKVMAWRRSDGERGWVSERLRFRGLTAPLAVGRSVVVGDFQGYLHFLSKQDGSLLARVPTDGSPIVAAPVLVGDTLVAVTKNGGVFGFRPD
jgi:outer membrane protein assembly factor BamB